MKKMFKKITVMTLACIMLMSTVAGCGGGGGKEKPITLTIYSQLANFSGEQTGWSAKIFLDKFNVIVNIVPDQDGVFETRMESGNLGDIIVFGSVGGDYQNAVNAGLLYDWEADDLLHEYGPYIEEHCQNALETNRNMNNGTIYSIGHNLATSTEDIDKFIYTWDLRWDLYKELGYPEFHTLDDLVEVLTAMKELAPTDDNGKETYAIGLWPDWDGTMVMYVKSMASAYYGYEGDFQLGLYNQENGEFYGALEEGGPYMTCLKFFNKLNQRGLIDPNSMTNTYEEMKQKLLASGYFMSIFDYSGSMIYNENHIEDNRQMLPCAPLDARPIVSGLSTLGGNRVWAIGANTEYPELCMEIINWFYTPEGTMTYNYGPQGLCWDYDEDGHPCFTEFGEQAYLDRETMMIGDYEGTGTFNDGAFAFNNTTWTLSAENLDSNGDKYDYQTWPSYQIPAKSEIEQDWRDYTGAT
ncbi:MAG: extracellular solute-binding protein, partial [Lachnospiraceae bacterium]|nr:extracellular solute-binding protein [Lachnospiraceae bacterium]